MTRVRETALERRPLRVFLFALGAGLGSAAGPSRGAGLCEVQQITGAFPEGLNSFGISVAMSGGWAGIGMIAESPVIGSSAHVYRVIGENLMPHTVLDSGVVASANFFGTSTAIDGSVLVVGDTGEAAPGPVLAAGAAYVYRIESGTPAFEQKLTASNLSPAAHFGDSVASWEDTILVGAGQATNQIVGAGAAYVFRYQGGRWIEEAMLGDPVPEQSAGFGGSVSLVGDVAMVGASHDDHPYTNTGAVYVFRYQAGQWNFEQELKPSDAGPAAGVQSFGSSVAIDGAGGTAVIGASEDLGQLGSAYVFEYDGFTWVETTKLQAKEVFGSPAFFGSEVRISQEGLTILVGAHADSEAGPTAGAAHLFRRIGDEWVEVEKFTKPGSSCLGATLALDGDLALVGDPCGQAGEVYLLAGMEAVDCNGNGEPDTCDIFTGGSADADGNGIPDECVIVGDLDGNGFVGIVDFLALLSSWGPCPGACPPSCPGDLDGDCAIGVTDFLALLAGWSVLPVPPICPGAEGCCGAHASAGCEDPACCEAVCTADPFCCQVVWDAVCVDEAQAMCGCPGPRVCGVPAAGNCCAFGGLAGPGCSDAACCEAICDYVDPFCCQVQWDSACQGWALQFCDCPPMACNPDAGNCCFPGMGEPGCNDLECCALVCEQIDPFCCDVAWDAICAKTASNFCDVCGGGF